MSEPTVYTMSLNAEELAMIEKFRAEKAKKSWGSVLRQINRIISVSFDNTSETFDVDFNPDFLDHSEFNRVKFENCLTSLGFKLKAYERSWMQISRI
jgi:hypothetical protein